MKNEAAVARGAAATLRTAARFRRHCRPVSKIPSAMMDLSNKFEAIMKPYYDECCAGMQLAPKGLGSIGSVSIADWLECVY